MPYTTIYNIYGGRVGKFDVRNRDFLANGRATELKIVVELSVLRKRFKIMNNASVEMETRSHN